MNSTPADAARAVTNELMSPFCPGLTLAACPSPAAHELRIEIRSRFECGETRDAIIEDLLRRFGSQIDGMPSARGIGALVWAVPFVVAVALGLAMRLALRGDNASGGSYPDAAQPAPHVLARLEDELEDME